METALYLIPVTLGCAHFEHSLPDYNRQIVRQIKHFIAENARSARKFLHKYDSGIPIDALDFLELNKRTDSKDAAAYLAPLLAGHSMGVISEAGCPAIADPGAAVVAAAHQRGLRVIPLVGPSSILMAMMSSGLNGQSFAFNGYLPVKANERADRLRFLEGKARREKQTQLFIETPYRNEQMIKAILSVCKADTMICVASGLTTEKEYICTKTVAQWKKEPLPPIAKTPTIFLIGYY